MKLTQKDKITLKFLLIFVGVIVLYYTFVFIIGDSFFDSYITFSTKVSAFILNIFLDNIFSNGSVLGNNSFRISLSFGCEGTEPMVVFLAGILAFPSAFKNKWKGLLSGLFILYLLNLVRICLLFLIGFKSPYNFELFHVIIFPILFIFIALFLWGWWATNLKKIVKS